MICRILSLVAVAVAIFWSPEPAAHGQVAEIFGLAPKIETISVTELNSLLDQQRRAEAEAASAGSKKPQPNFVLVDVRTEAEVNVSIIPGAITKAEFEKNQDKYKNVTVIPYCTVGGRSGKYAKEIVKTGASVKNFEESILGWVKAELPLVKPDGSATNQVYLPSDRYTVPDKYDVVKP